MLKVCNRFLGAFCEKSEYYHATNDDKRWSRERLAAKAGLNLDTHDDQDDLVMIKVNDIHQESIFPFRECGAAHVPLTAVMIVNRSRTCRHGGYKKERTTNIVSAAFWEPAPISAAIGDCGQLCLLFGGAKMMSPVQLCFGRREKAI